MQSDDEFWARHGHDPGFHPAPADASAPALAWCPDADPAPIGDLLGAHRDRCTWCTVRARHAIAQNAHTTALCAGIAIQRWAQWLEPEQEQIPGSKLVWMCRQWWENPGQDLDFLTTIATEATVEERSSIVMGVLGVIGTWQHRGCPVEDCDYAADVRIGVDDAIEPYFHNGGRIEEPAGIPAAAVFAAEHPHHRDRPVPATLTSTHRGRPLHRRLAEALS